MFLMYKTCPYSGVRFVPRRRNQVFACEQNRRDYHNEKAAELRHIKAPISRSLDKNFKVLNQLVEIGQIKTFKTSDLVSLGFNPKVFTHIEEFEGQLCRCVYQFIFPKSKSPDSITVIHPRND